MSRQTSTQVLPQRYALIFKQLIRFYETKQYKKGLRAADQILKAQAGHGETMAMKGLILNCMGPEQQHQALPMIKKGLLANMQSHICWHVLGLYHRAAREYAQAIKAYLRALHIDHDNIQILRDLSLLQIQIRDLSGYEETRRRILVLQPAARQNWLAYSVAACLSGQYQRALDILSAYHQTLDQDTKSYEYSEMIMFQLRIMIEHGLLHEALQFSHDHCQSILDVLALKQIQADLMLKLGRHEEAADLYRHLLDINPDHMEYHLGWQSALQCTSEDLLQKYEQLQQLYPDANLPRLLPLQFITDSSIFTSLADSYLRSGLQRHIPCLFRCIRRFYSDTCKMSILSNLITTFANEEPTSKQSLMLYAQHLDYIQDHDLALNLIDRILELHSGEIDRSCIDILLLKARILKHLGAYTEAHSVMDQCRRLDLQDRYLNTKTVKYALRAGLLSDADQVVSLFLRDGDTVISLFDMQCMWYELGVGEALLRQKHYGPALKRFHQVDIHFNDIADDQFDFHMYCIRRQTLSVYISMLKWEDTLRSHRFAVRAALNSARIYLNLHRQSLQPISNHVEDQLKSDNDVQRSKRETAKARRSHHKLDKDGKDVDGDSDGESFLKDGNFLTKCRDHVQNLLMFARTSMETYLISVDLYMYLNLPLRVLHSLIHASQLPDATSNHSYQRAILRFALQYTVSDDMIGQVIQPEINSLLPSTYPTPAAYAHSLISQYSSSNIYMDRVHAADLMSLIEADSDSIRSLIMSFETGAKPSLSTLVDAQQIVDERFPQWSSEFQSKAHVLYPSADVFKA